MSATSGGGGSVSEGSEAGGSSQSTMSVGDSPSTSFQTNLAENVTKITLSEENGAGGFGADVTGSKINLSLDERQQKDGIVNVAFDYEEGTDRGNGGGGDMKPINGSEKKDKVAEAVNLELVNMVPYSNGNGTSYGVPVNGIPMKKDSEQDMSTPYDEYFVPVNEHKKYMRGEKLYVTKDKRRPTSWRRCLSWVVACTVISVVLILAILAGTGVILSQESDFVKEASLGRNFAGSNSKASVTNKSPTPTAEMYMYVPRSIESEFVIDNLDFDPAFQDLNSTAYQQFATNMEDQLKMLLFDKENLEFGASDVELKVVNVSRNPFKVNYRIGWNYKQGVNNPPEPIKMEDVKKRLVDSLARNQGYIDKYHIDREAIKVNHVINTCQMENGGCSHICYYNYITQQFVCTCPTHLVLDGSGKNCVAWTGSSEEDALPVPSHTAYPGSPYEPTANPVLEHDMGAHYEHELHHHFENHNDQHSSKLGSQEHEEHGEQEPVAEPVPEPTAEPRPDHKDLPATYIEHSSHPSHGIDDHGASPEPTPEPTADAKESHDHLHHHLEHTHSNHDLDSTYKMKEPEAEPKPEPNVEVNSEENQGTHFIYGSKDHEPSAEPTPEPSPEPTADLNSEGRSHDQDNHFMYGLKEHEPPVEPTAEPEPEPTAAPNSYGQDHESEPTSGSTAKGVSTVDGHNHVDHLVYESKEPEPSAEPEPVPTSEDSTAKGHDHVGHSVYESKEPEPSAEPEPEPTSKEDSDAKGHDHVGHSVYETKEPEPTAEPEPEPTSKEDSDAKGHDHVGHSVYETKEHEPSAEPEPKPTFEEDSDAKGHDHVGHSVYETKEPEPSAEPEPQPKSEEDSNINHHSIYEPKDHEPSAEPTPEPTVDENVNVKDQGHSVQSVHESNDHEAPAPFQEYSDANAEDHSLEKTGHSVSGPLDNEPIAEPTPEPTAESDSGKDHHSGAHSLHEPTSQEMNTTGEISSAGSGMDHGSIQTIESNDKGPGPQPTSESSVNLKDETEHHTVVVPEITTEKNNEPSVESAPELSLKSGTNPEQLEVTIHSEKTLEHVSPSHELNQTTESQTEYPNAQKESGEETKSVHHVPYLEDILIRKPSPNMETHNAEGHSQNPLDNVELTEDGKPVIEEVIIDSGKKSPVGFSPNTTQHQDPNSSVTAGTNSNDGAKEVEGNNESGKVLDETWASSENPRTVEYNPREHLNHDEVDKSGSGSVGNPSFESTSIRNDQGGSDLNSEDVTTTQTLESKNTTQEQVPITAHPEVQTENHTITINMGDPSLAETSSEVESKQGHMSAGNSDSSLSTDESSRNNSETLSGRPGIIEIDHISPEKTTGEVGSSQTAVQETATEPEVAATTLLTILTPEGVEQIMSQLSKNLSMKEPEVENRTINVRQNQPEENEETSKSPEEISNNIKDELLENEEFNILLDKEYKPIEGKDVISKYPNKPLKTEKKKIKDYVKGEKVAEGTVKPAVTPEDFILQKHVNGNENIYDLEYSLQNEHTTKPDGQMTITDPHSIEGIPGISFKPHGISNHDISILQTVAPDFRTETISSNGAHEQETLKPDSKTKLLDNKEGELKGDYPKFDKDYKYEKQKVSKKKELKKKIGGKDGKNVELDDGKKYFPEVTKEDMEVGYENGKDVPETTMNPSFARPDIKTETEYEYKVKADDTTIPTSGSLEERVEVQGAGVTEQPNFKSTNAETTEIEKHTEQAPSGNQNEHKLTVDQNGHLIIDEPTVRSRPETSPGTVYDGQLPGEMTSSSEGARTNQSTTNAEGKTEAVNMGLGIPQTIINQSGAQENTGPVTFGYPEVVPAATDSAHNSQETMQTANIDQDNKHPVGNTHGIPGTVFDGIPRDSTSSTQGEGNTAYGVYQTTHSQILPGGMVNSTTIHPTIIIHGQSGSLQDGHTMRFANSTFHNPGNATIVSIFNGTLTHPEGHSFSFTNYTATFPNGSAVHPTIVVRGQSGTLQDGHESKFKNGPFMTTTTYTKFKNSDVFRIENETFPGTVFDGHFNPRNGHYHMFSNSSGTFVYTNASTPPAFVITGQSGDFGNSTGYVLSNHTRTTVSGGFVGPQSVIFRNSTVFAVESPVPGAGIQEITVQPHEVTNETLKGPFRVGSSGTAYKVNDYFGYISKCAAGQFQCENGTSKRGSACISLSSKCDSIPDCSDGSDELKCIENGCPGNFQCADGTCLKRNLVCNGILDCSDASDEKNCESWKCEFDEFQCPSGRCIPVVWQCDGKPDCDNHTDEHNCQTSCGNDEYLCPEGWCIPLTYKCNGVKECSNGEDEQLCDCSHEEFKCHTGGCVPMKDVCNGLDDCPDRSDEWDCVKLEPDTNLLKIRSASGNYDPVCADGWSSPYSDEVCSSLGYFSSVPIDTENGSSILTDSAFYVLKNHTTADFNKKIIVNLRYSNESCSSGKLVKISCQEFSCGSRSMTDSSSVEARLVGGMSAATGQWPSVALLYNLRNFHSCTANVLTPKWVLASYNCLKMGGKNLNEQDWKFYGGSTVFEAERENAETRKIVAVIPHPQLKFNQFLFTNDLALVELDLPLQFTSNLGAVCLPEQDIQPRQICVTAGWGMNGPEDKSIRQQLQYLPVPTMNLTECNSTEHYSGFITDDKICAGYNSAQKSLCYNEEGAPLMCVNDRGEWELQGVLSYHSNCGRGSHPSIFSSITRVSDWIKKTIGHNFDRKALIITKR